MRGRVRLSTAALGVLVIAAALAAVPVGAAGPTQPESYVKNCRGVLPTLPIGTTEGTEGDDVMVGTAHDDVIHGNGGNDLICGREGNDTFDGGAGEDYLVGNEGDDVLYGGPGRDTLAGGPGCDLLYGGNGNDLLLPGTGGPHHGQEADCTGAANGGAGADHILLSAWSVNDFSGGPGLDLLDFHPMMGELTIDLAAGTYAIATGSGPISGAALEFERARGTWGPDTMLGTDGPNRLAGMHGSDTIRGRGGDDFLNGGTDSPAVPDTDLLFGDDVFDTCVEGEVTTDCEA